MSLIDNLVTRFPNGVTNNDVGSIFNSLKNPDPTQYHTYFEDFDYYVAADWTVTETQAGATQALTDADGGVILLTNTAADNDLNAMQKVGESFLMESGKKAFFRARLKVSDATQSDVVIGLQITDTTPLDVTDGIYFLKADDAATLTVICRKNATTGSTSATVGTIADDTWFTVGWFYDGGDRVYYSFNNTIIGSLDGSSSFLPDTELTVSFAVQNGAAAAKNLSVDYVFAAKER